MKGFDPFEYDMDYLSKDICVCKTQNEIDDMKAVPNASIIGSLM